MSLLTETRLVNGRWHSPNDQASHLTPYILFVEDETFVRNVTCEILESAGYRVLVAKDAAEAECLHDAHCGEVDLLFTDVVLPGQSGPALASALRQKNPRLKILFATGYPEQLQSGIPSQAECLAKPFSSTTLLKTIGTLLAGNQLEPEREGVVRQTSNLSLMRAEVSKASRPKVQGLILTPACGNELPAGSDQELLTAALCG